MFFNLYHGGMDTPVNIHVLAALQSDFFAVSGAILGGENVTIHMTVDDNRWRSNGFFHSILML